MARYIKFFDEYQILNVIKAYLFDAKSHRDIQKDVLNLPAPTNGGGYVVMDILHHYGIGGDKKGVLIGRDIDSELNEANGMYAEALKMIKDYVYVEKTVEKNILTNKFNLDNTKTEISVQTKVRINQSTLRKFVLDNYRHSCAICDIDKEDLLICSHIKPWAIDQENRLNPKNAICFCVLHDRLFDRGYFSLDENYKVVLSKKADDKIKTLLANSKFKEPKDFLPDKKFLEFHYEEICK